MFMSPGGTLTLSNPGARAFDVPNEFYTKAAEAACDEECPELPPRRLGVNTKPNEYEQLSNFSTSKLPVNTDTDDYIPMGSAGATIQPSSSDDSLHEQNNVYERLPEEDEQS